MKDIDCNHYKDGKCAFGNGNCGNHCCKDCEHCIDVDCLGACETALNYLYPEGEE